KEYAKVIRALGAEDRVIVQSFDWEFLRSFREELPGIPLGALGSKPLTPERIESLRALKPDWVGWHFADLLPADVPRLREWGAKIALWTVNDPAVAKQWVESGVQAIITDVPDRIAEALAGEG